MYKEWQYPCILLPQFFATVFSLPNSLALDVAANSTMHMDFLLPRDDNDDFFDPEDLSNITKLAAIGDSYSAGIGAGNRLGIILNSLLSDGGESDLCNPML